MALVIRHASIAHNGKKVAEVMSNSYTITAGGEDLFGDDGWQGMSDGAIVCKLSADMLVPVKGISTSLLTALLQQKYVQMRISLIDGKIHQVTMKITEAKFDSDAKSGNLKGSFSFSGGKPDVTG